MSNSENMTPSHVLMELFARAASFAAEHHKNQRRKTGESYFVHPLRVAAALAECIRLTPRWAVARGSVEEISDTPEENLLLLLVALFHDLLEDTQCTYEEIAEGFGHKVADAVKELTDDKDLPKDVRKDLCIKHSHDLSRMAALVKIADVCDNCAGILGGHAPENWDEDRIAAYGKWSCQVVSGAYMAIDWDVSHQCAVDTAYAQRLLKNSPLEIDEHGAVRVSDTP